MKKLLTLAFLLAFLAFSTGTVFAQEASPITGTVQLVELGTDPDTGETFVIVTLTDGTGATQVVNISLAAAETLGLVDTSSGEPVVNEESYNTEVTIEPADVLPGTGEGEGEEEAQHPVGGALSEFFSELLGVDYDTVMSAHEDGFGFGVIAQALWLTNQIDGDTETFNALLEAKKTGDYSNIILADGSTPDNWGNVVRSLKKGSNLGSVMSGKAENNEDPAGVGFNGERGNGKGQADNASGKNQTGGEANGNGSGQGNNGNGNGHGNGNSGGNGNDNGKGNHDGNGNGKP